MLFIEKCGDTSSKPCHAAMVSDDSASDEAHAVQGRRQWGTVPDTLWCSVEGHEAELADWLTTQPGVTIRSHGGFAPEQWAGQVDGHRFEFRERHGQWNIEIDHRPSGRPIQTFAGTDINGSPIYRTRELETGEHIASGTTDAAGYGNTSIERAQFIIETIRTHLTRQGCSHHLDKLDEMDVLLGGPVRWCPRCGAHLPGR